MTLAVTPTIACLHALRVAVFLRVPGNGSHIGHVVTLSVGVGRVRRVSRHVRRGRVVLCEADGEERAETDSGDSLFTFITALFVKCRVL